jgi:hypothetical protein
MLISGIRIEPAAPVVESKTEIAWCLLGKVDMLLLRMLNLSFMGDHCAGGRRGLPMLLPFDRRRLGNRLDFPERWL